MQMQLVNYLEVCDKIYILDAGQAIEVELTDADILNKSTTDPKFLYKETRLKSIQVENDQVLLEDGQFYDNSVGMSIDYGYRFNDSKLKAFTSLEALEKYRDEYLVNRQNLLKADYEKMKSTVDEHLAYIAAALESNRGFNRLHQITEEERASLDYLFIENLHEAIYGEPMF